jgi:hypothetical protein
MSYLYDILTKVKNYFKGVKEFTEEELVQLKAKKVAYERRKKEDTTAIELISLLFIGLFWTGIGYFCIIGIWYIVYVLAVICYSVFGIFLVKWIFLPIMWCLVMLLRGIEILIAIIVVLIIIALVLLLIRYIYPKLYFWLYDLAKSCFRGIGLAK